MFIESRLLTVMFHYSPTTTWQPTKRLTNAVVDDDDDLLTVSIAFSTNHHGISCTFTFFVFCVLIYLQFILVQRQFSFNSFKNQIKLLCNYTSETIPLAFSSILFTNSQNTWSPLFLQSSVLMVQKP